MGNYVGVWVSHGFAKIVNLSANGRSNLFTLESNIERKHKSTSGTPSKTPYTHGGVAVTRYTDRLHHQLQNFYSTILARISPAEKIYLLGPGLAKKELKNQMQKRKDLVNKIIGVEPSDKMTDPQLVAKVKSRFGIRK